MNDALCAGADVAKGSRHASNPGDSWVSGSYAIYWRSMMHFFHRARANWGLSCFLWMEQALPSKRRRST